jgi:hypothetical protein
MPQWTYTKQNEQDVYKCTGCRAVSSSFEKVKAKQRERGFQGCDIEHIIIDPQTGRQLEHIKTIRWDSDRNEWFVVRD